MLFCHIDDVISVHHHRRKQNIFEIQKQDKRTKKNQIFKLNNFFLYPFPFCVDICFLQYDIHWPIEPLATGHILFHTPNELGRQYRC